MFVLYDPDKRQYVTSAGHTTDISKARQFPVRDAADKTKRGDQIVLSKDTLRTAH